MEHHARDFMGGSGAGNGASGGPWISNIGYLQDVAADQGQYPWRNIIFATTSWGYTVNNIPTSYKMPGASSLSGPNNSNNFTGMFNAACNFAQSLYGSSSCTQF